MPLYTPQERQKILDLLIAALQTDNRITGAILVGSGSVGFDDEYSDIDMAIIVAAEDDVDPVSQEWLARFEELLPVAHHFIFSRAPNVYLYGFMLENFLELDISFQSISDLSARRERWKVAFDRTGKIEPFMQASWANRTEPDLRETYFRWLNSIWHYVLHIGLCVKRGHLWRARHYLEQLRDRTVELAGLNNGLNTSNFRQVDQMPDDFRIALQETLVSELESDEILRALRAATRCFFKQAHALDEKLDFDYSSSLAAKMEDYLRILPST